jgi:prophage regulatory protein
MRANRGFVMTATAILRLPEVLARSGLSRTNVYRRVAAGTFPRPVALGPRAVGWRESDIIEWIDALTTKPQQAA